MIEFTSQISAEWVGQLGYGNEEAYFANLSYCNMAEEVLEAVGFYATAPTLVMKFMW